MGLLIQLVRLGIGLVAYYWLCINFVLESGASSIAGAVAKIVSPILALLFLGSFGWEMRGHGRGWWWLARLGGAVLFAAPFTVMLTGFSAAAEGGLFPVGAGAILTITLFIAASTQTARPLDAVPIALRDSAVLGALGGLCAVLVFSISPSPLGRSPVENALAVAWFLGVVAVAAFLAWRRQSTFPATVLTALELVLASVLLPSLLVSGREVVQDTVDTRRAILAPLAVDRFEGPGGHGLMYVGPTSQIDPWGVKMVNSYYEQARLHSVRDLEEKWLVEGRLGRITVPGYVAPDQTRISMVLEIEVASKIRLIEVRLGQTICRRGANDSTLLKRGSRALLPPWYGDQGGGWKAFECEVARVPEGAAWSPPPTVPVDLYWTPESAGLRPPSFRHTRVAVSPDGCRGCGK